jgi:Zn-dependent protease
MNQEETAIDPGVPPEGPLLRPAPRLSRSALWILILVPLAFMPMFRLTFPHVGLWPAAVVAILSLRLLRGSPSSVDRAVARGGIGVVIAVAFFTLVPVLSNQLPGSVPGLVLETGGKTSDWWIKAATFVVLILSISLHECAHAASAWCSGDSTAKDMGRLTLNPVRHVELFGTIVLPAILTFLPGGFVFGWAKPVPVSPSLFRNIRRGQVATSVAGVAANLTLALFFASALGAIGVILHATYPDITSRGFMNPWRQVEFAGLPSAGAWVLLVETLKSGVSLNMILFCLNILPVPPLDGFGLLEGVAPRVVQPLLARVRGWGMFLFLALIFTKALDYLLLPGALAALFLNYIAGAFAKLA